MSSNRGFTLPELIATVAIAGILSGMALPSFASMVGRHAVAVDANRLLSVVLLARGEAIRRNAPVVICRSNDGTTCLPRNDHQWNRGVLVFADDGRDPASPGGVDLTQRGNGRVDGGEATVLFESPLSARSTISGGPNSALLRFEGDGRPYGLANTTFLLTARTDADQARKLVVSGTGRPRVVAP